MIKIKLSAFADEAGNSIDKQICALKANGVYSVELRSIDNINVSDFTIEQAKEYFKTFSENGISVWAIGSPLGKVDIDCDFNAYKNKIHHVCQLANVFETERIRAFSFFNAYNKSEKVIEYLLEMVNIAKKYGVHICHENEKDVYGDTKERVLELIDKVDGLKVVYDPANFVQCGENADATLDLFHKNAEYFHIKDVISSTDELVPAGYGDGNISRLISMINRSVTLTLEPHLAVFDAFKSIDKSVMKHKFKFENNEQAFSFAVSALKELLIKNGYVEELGYFVKNV